MVCVNAYRRPEIGDKPRNIFLPFSPRYVCVAFFLVFFISFFFFSYLIYCPEVFFSLCTLENERTMQQGIFMVRTFSHINSTVYVYASAFFFPTLTYVVLRGVFILFYFFPSFFLSFFLSFIYKHNIFIYIIRVSKYDLYIRIVYTVHTQSKE